MLVELSARLPGAFGVGDWSNEPWEFALWAFLHLREIDYRASWVARWEQLNLATLVGIALSVEPGPAALDVERDALLRDAAPANELIDPAELDAARTAWLATSAAMERARLVESRHG